MTNLEKNPQEEVCTNRPARFTDGLADGVRTAESDRGLVEILEPRAVPLGGPRAMTVNRTLPQRVRSLIGAWCFLDFYGPDDVAQTGGMRVSRHPHTGLATVSWLFEGRVDHLDSAGNWATVRPGEVNLMNAGRGITHSEFSTDDTSVLHGVQLWYAFPDRHRFTEPSLDWHRPEPVHGEGSQARVMIGSALGQTSPVRTYLPLTALELRLDPGATVELEVPPEHEHGLQQVAGTVFLDGVEVPRHHLGYVPTGRSTVRVSAGDEPVIAVLVGGEPLGEQIVMWWNFVGRSHEEIVTWRAAYQQEMGFDPAAPDSPLTRVPDGGQRPVHGPTLDALAGTHYDDGREFPQFGDFPPDQPAPMPAPALPTTRMRPRGAAG